MIYITGWLGDQIKPYVQANYPQYRARFVVQDELVGQSHAIWLARKHIGGPCFIVFADTISRIDLKAMTKQDADGVLGVWQVEDPRRLALLLPGPTARWTLCRETVEYRAQAGHHGRLLPARGPDLITAIEEQMARKQMLKGEFFLADAFNRMLEKGARFLTETMTVRQYCGVPSDEPGDESLAA